MNKLTEVLLKKQKSNFDNNTLTIYLAYEIEKVMLERNGKQIREMIANKHRVNSEDVKIEYVIEGVNEDYKVNNFEIPTTTQTAINLEDEKPPW